jgi:hypothetical protein
VLKRITTLIVGALMMMALAVPAFAVSPSERECEGTFSRERGEVKCVVVEEGKNKKFQQEETTSGRGNIENKQQVEEECNRPGQTEKCPPGQF